MFRSKTIQEKPKIAYNYFAVVKYDDVSFSKGRYIGNARTVDFTKGKRQNDFPAIATW
jgi:hypothetical protein